MTSLYNILKANRLGMDSNPWVAMLGEAWKASEEDFEEYTGLVPYTFIANGQPLLDWYIKGNMQQTGTPTPTTPIQPQETGERTDNLLNPVPYKEGYYINENGVETQATGQFNIWSFLPTTGQAYTLSLNTSLSGSTVRIHAYINGVWAEQVVYSAIQNLPVIFTAPNNCDEIRISASSTATNHFMLNTGSTALPYEPYGFKIPISNNSQTYNKYLGEVQTVRKIKKLVFTGQEIWSATTDSVYIDKTNFSGEPALEKSPLYCSHYPNDVTGMIMGNSWWFRCYGSTNVQNWKTYLQQQYANGTPVTVWYVLSSATTAIVNEPIRKIGNYVDILTAEQAGVEIPTNIGRNTIDINTDIKPSEFYMKWKGR